MHWVCRNQKIELLFRVGLETGVCFGDVIKCLASGCCCKEILGDQGCWVAPMGSLRFDEWVRQVLVSYKNLHGPITFSFALLVFRAVGFLLFCFSYQTTQD